MTGGRCPRCGDPIDGWISDRGRCAACEHELERMREWTRAYRCRPEVRERHNARAREYQRRQRTGESANG